jgi:hypothetical protein
MNINSSVSLFISIRLRDKFGFHTGVMLLYSMKKLHNFEDLLLHIISYFSPTSMFIHPVVTTVCRKLVVASNDIVFISDFMNSGHLLQI